MTEKDDGGPAYPHGIWAEGQGMSLRDWFAGQALAGILSDRDHCVAIASEDPSKDADLIAAASFRFADAMLKARKGE